MLTSTACPPWPGKTRPLVRAGALARLSRSAARRWQRRLTRTAARRWRASCARCAARCSSATCGASCIVRAPPLPARCLLPSAASVVRSLQQRPMWAVVPATLTQLLWDLLLHRPTPSATALPQVTSSRATSCCSPMTSARRSRPSVRVVTGSARLQRMSHELRRATSGHKPPVCAIAVGSCGVARRH
jgi:hypothetical protein